MRTMADVTAVWSRDDDHYDRVSRVRWDRMDSPGEKSWFARKAQELVDTQAADYGPDLIATLPDDTTYSVAGDHGGIQRDAQQVPIVFAGAGLSSRDLRAEVRSVDIMPTLVHEAREFFRIAPTGWAPSCRRSSSRAIRRRN